MLIGNYIAKLIKNIPTKTGVYQYYDNNQNLLYVGKAKDLKKRVNSYFIKKQKNKKTRVLVSKISDIKYVVLNNEMDALLLENNLIKKHQPKYNVLLKDDKTYPWICVKKEPFPRVFQTRKIINDGSDYFGPYTSVRLIKTLLGFFHEIYPLRTCSFNLNKENIKKQKFSVCLEHHIGNCLAPCVGKQTSFNYHKSIAHIKQIIKGDVKSVIRSLESRMLTLSEKLQFEEANSIKETIRLLKNYQAKSTIVSQKINNIDVFTIASDQKTAFVNYLKINSGSIILSYSLKIKKLLNETDEKLLQLAIVELRGKFNSKSKTIYSSIPLKRLFKQAIVISPKIGDKKKLISLSLHNAKQMLTNHNASKPNKQSVFKKKRVLEKLQKDLCLLKYPKHIECFDNSNIQGSHPVAACVVFKNGLPAKKEYRHFNIKTVIGPNDFASMEEVVFRRYSRLLKEQKNLPQLIVIDGGKGQVSSAFKSLKKLNLIKKITVIGIAKKLEEIFLSEDPVPVFLDKRSESLKLIQQLRNEAHRFSIKHHRKKRSKNMLKTSLDEINGIGPKTTQILLSYFGSVNRVFSAKKKELLVLIGKNKTTKILRFKKNIRF